MRMNPSAEPAFTDAEVLSVPGKSFLLGEYLAMDGGPSILLATKPRFELHVRSYMSGEMATESEASPFSLLSPAGRLFSALRERTQKINFTFYDPHEARGGLGASSAQWALLYAWSTNLMKEAWPAPRLSWQNLLQAYRASAWDGVGNAPSGADVVAQLSGGVTFFDGASSRAEILRWPFADVGFSLLRTGNKLATHLHLKELQMPPLSEFKTLVLEAKIAIESSDVSGLARAINGYATELNKYKLVANETSLLLRRVSDELPLLAAKGCGAMGVDVVLLLHSLSEQSVVAKWAQEMGLQVVGTQDDLDVGLKREKAKST